MLTKLLAKLRTKWTLFTCLGILVGFLGGMKTGKNLDVIYIYADSVVTVTDTLQVDKVSYVELPAKIDTVTITETFLDTLTNTVIDTIILTEVANLDTLLEDGYLSLRYYVRPRYFDFTWDPIPLEVRCNQVFGGTIGINAPQLRLFSLSAGVGAGKAWEEGDLHLSGLFAGHFNKNMVYLEVDSRGYAIGYGKKFY